MRFIALALTALLLAGCAAIEQNPATTTLAIQVATMKVIEQDAPEDRAARALRIASVAKEAQTIIDLSPVTIPELQAAVNARIAELDDLEPSDRALVSLLVTAIAEELQERVGEGLLDANDRQTVSEVLRAVEQAASIYL